MKELTVAIVGLNEARLDVEREIFEAGGIRMVTVPKPSEGGPLPLELQHADGMLMSGSWPVNRSVMSQLKRCRVIGRYGLGYDSIDVDEATRRGIAVVIARGYCEEEMSDHALALMLSWHRRIPFYDRRLHTGRPIPVRIPIPRISTLTAGLCGFGNVARRLAPKLHALGMRVIAFDPYADPRSFTAMNVEHVDFDTLLTESDVISIHCALTQQTQHLFNATAFAKMKPNALLINTARGAIIDTGALVQALNDGQIAGACLDVLETDAMEQHNLKDVEPLLLTPHMAWQSDTARIELSRRAALNVRAVLEGKRPEGLVNHDVAEVLNLVG